VRRTAIPVRAIVTGASILLLVIPTVIVLIASLTTGQQVIFPPNGLTFHWYVQIVQDGPTWHALINSFHVALVSVAVTLLAGVPAAIALSRFSTRWRVVITLVLSVGFSAPLIVSAFAFFDVFTRLAIVDHLTAIGFAVGIVNFPFMLWPVISTLEDQDPELTAAAATLGADPVEQFLFVRLPLMAPGIVTGAIIVFVASITDFVVSEVLTTAEDQTLPVFIYSALRSTVSPSLGAASALFIGIATAVFVLVLRLGGVERFLLRKGA
jgi:putative spermidine/putrescine transport system permease protein